MAAAANQRRLPPKAFFEVLESELVVTVVRGTNPGPGSLSLGDGLCIAVAERLGLPLTGGDAYWSQMPLQVEFLPFR